MPHGFRHSIQVWSTSRTTLLPAEGQLIL